MVAGHRKNELVGQDGHRIDVIVRSWVRGDEHVDPAVEEGRVAGKLDTAHHVKVHLPPRSEEPADYAGEPVKTRMAFDPDAQGTQASRGETRHPRPPGAEGRRGSIRHGRRCVAPPP